MEKDKQQLSVEVARLYYQSDYSQQEIANKLNISRPTISRLLKYAKEKGFVQISIADPFADLDNVGNLLKEKYNLLEAHVVFSPVRNMQRLQSILVNMLLSIWKRRLKTVISLV